MDAQPFESSLQLYQLIINQLQQDGHEGLAKTVSTYLNVPIPPSNPRASLRQLVDVADHVLKKNGFDILQTMTESRSMEEENPIDILPDDLLLDDRAPGLDLDTGSLHRPASIGKYGTRYVAKHKMECVVARFDSMGTYVATGAIDPSVKVLDVKKMIECKTTKTEIGDPTKNPVLKTLYGQDGTITDIEFFPTVNKLMSADKCTIRIYDLNGTTKQPKETKPETAPIRSLAFHPSGNFLLVATESNMLRLYDYHTFTPYVCSFKNEHHNAAINQARYSSDYRSYASCSDDGCVRVWDTVTNRCSKYIPNAHRGEPVTSLQFSRNGKYLLTSGIDAKARLWDLRMDKLLKVFDGVFLGKSNFPTTFTHDEQRIALLDEKENTVLLWNVLTGNLDDQLIGHKNTINFVASSTTDSAIITCSKDCHARFWYAEST